MISIRHPAIGWGKTEAPKAEEQQKITKETKNKRRINARLVIDWITGLEGGGVILCYLRFLL